MTLWRRARSVTRSDAEARQFIMEYLALRVWALLISCFPVRLNLITGKLMGRAWWMLMKRHQERALDNLRPALGDRYSEAQLRRIARRSFEHFAQLYLVELVMTPRLVNEWSWSRYVDLVDLGPALRELLSQRGVILLTPHFGNYELLGYTIARLGLPMTAVMRPLDNPLINEHLIRSRQAGGLDLLYKQGVSEAAESILDSGGAISFIADQDAGPKGIFANFFNRPASWYKSIGLLAIQKNVPVVVGVASRKQKDRFAYEIRVPRVIRPEEWIEQADPLQYVTDAFAAALESAIRLNPEQYLWMHRRWKTRPRWELSEEELAAAKAKRAHKRAKRLGDAAG